MLAFRPVTSLVGITSTFFERNTMPDGLVRTGDFRQGSPITLPHNFGNKVNWQVPDPAKFGNPVNTPVNFGNPVTWTPSPAHFGNLIGQRLGPYALMQIASDNFQRVNENPLSDNGHWVVPAASGITFVAMELVNDLAVTTSTVDGSCMIWTGNSFTESQYSMVTIGTIAANNYIELFILSHPTGGNYYRFFITFSGPWGLQRNGAYVAKNTTGPYPFSPQSGDTWTLIADSLSNPSGTLFTVYQNGVSVISYLDSTPLTSGTPGFGMFGPTIGGGVSATSWIGGNISLV